MYFKLKRINTPRRVLKVCFAVVGVWVLFVVGFLVPFATTTISNDNVSPAIDVSVPGLGDSHPDFIAAINTDNLRAGTETEVAHPSKDDSLSSGNLEVDFEAWTSDDPFRAAQLSHKLDVWNLTFALKEVPSPSGIHESSTNVSGTTTQESTTKAARLILHIGPAKTGTSSLQTDLNRLSGVLRQDGYLYAGRQSRWGRQHLSEWLRVCPTRMASAGKRPPPCWRKFQRCVTELSQQNGTKSVILSEEMFSNQLWTAGGTEQFRQHYWPILQRHWSEIHVVAVYRRLPEWLHSARKQRDVQLDERQRFDGGEPLDAWKEVQFLRGHDRQSGRPHYLPSALAQWQELVKDKVVSSVTVLNLHHTHQSGNATKIARLLEQFVCEYLPDASNACAQARQKRFPRMSNARTNRWYWYDHIVFDAVQRGLLVPGGRRRRSLARNLTAHHLDVLGHHVTDLPLQCPPSSDMHDLWYESWYWEQYYAGATSASVDNIRASLRRLVEDRSFCRVDTERLFEGLTSWEQVLERLV